MALDLVKKRDQQLGTFRRQFDVFKHQFGNPVQPCEKMRTVAFTGAVKVEDVSASPLHGAPDPVPALLMSNAEISEELFAQEGDFPVRDPDVPLGQGLDDFPFPTATDKKGISHIDNDVVAEGAPVRGQPPQFLGRIDDAVLPGFQMGLSRLKCPDIQGDQLFPACLEHGESIA